MLDSRDEPRAEPWGSQLYLEYTPGPTKEKEPVALAMVADFLRAVIVFISVIVFIIGIPCNALVIRILSMRSARDPSLSTYLVSLAVSNLCLLMAECSRYVFMGLIGVSYRALHPTICYSHRFVAMNSLLTSNWLMVFITFTRWHITRYPTSSLLSPRCLGVSVAVLVICNSSVVILILFLLLVTRDTRIQGVKIGACSLYYGTSRAYFILPVFMFVPMTCLTALTVMILVRIRPSLKLSRTVHTVAQFHRMVYFRKLAVLLAVVNVQFVVSNLPLTAVYVIWDYVLDTDSQLQTTNATLATRISRLIMYGSYVTNCLFYSLLSARFRNHLYKNYLSKVTDEDVHPVYGETEEMSQDLDKDTTATTDDHSTAFQTNKSLVSYPQSRICSNKLSSVTSDTSV